MRGLRRPIALFVIGVVLITLGILVAGCGSEPSATERDAATRDRGVTGLIQAQPAKTMRYSPTRETINFWIETWDEPGKLAYVYLQSANGDLLGYYVFEGLPVSYCASITQTEKLNRNSEGAAVLKQPSVDGVYYAGAGSCNTYYGRDASTKSYIEYTAGLGINVLLYDRPLPRQDVAALGFTTIAEAKKAK